MQLEVNDAGTSKRLTIQQPFDLVGDSLGNESVANQRLRAGTDAMLVGSTLAIPTGGLRQKTALPWSSRYGELSFDITLRSGRGTPRVQRCAMRCPHTPNPAVLTPTTRRAS